jgi:histone H3/H4
MRLEIRGAIKATPKFCIDQPRLRRLVKEIVDGIKPGYRVHKFAIAAIHEAVESFLVEILTYSSAATAHAKRVTLFREDIGLVLFILGMNKSPPKYRPRTTRKKKIPKKRAQLKVLSDSESP